MLRYLGFGLLFGFVLVRSGATNPDLIAGMFLLENLHLMGVIGVAIALAAVGFAWIRKRGVAGADGKPLKLQPKPRTAGNLWGGLLFGAGWALTGTCPGTALAQVGEGRLAGLLTIGGIVLGTLAYKAWGPAVEALLARLPRRLPVEATASLRS